MSWHILDDEDVTTWTPERAEAQSRENFDGEHVTPYQLQQAWLSVHEGMRNLLEKERTEVGRLAGRTAELASWVERWMMFARDVQTMPPDEAAAEFKRLRLAMREGEKP